MLAAQAHFPLLEVTEPSEMLETQAHFPQLEDIEPSEMLATQAHFPLLKDSASSEASAESVFMLETELFDLMNEFFNTISSCEVFKILCNL